MGQDTKKWNCTGKVNGGWSSVWSLMWHTSKTLLLDLVQGLESAGRKCEKVALACTKLELDQG